jgi:4'-phosphopantetheinyl transferase
MPALYWLLQRSSDLPADNHWLTPCELNSLTSLRFERRRADWRLGRWTAKHALAAYSNSVAGVGLNLEDIEISNDADGAPHARYEGAGECCALSISHRGGAALCVVSPACVSIGCDLELIEERSSEFVGDYFTATERCFVHDAATKDQACLTALIWSAKESALKALAVGLSIDTRAVEVSHYGWGKYSQESWQALLMRSMNDSQTFHGWWCAQDNRVLTMLATAQTGTPVLLEPV